MTTTLDDTATHPVAAFAARAREVLADVVSPEGRPVWSMTSDELRRTLLDLAAFESEVSALKLEVLAEAERTEACVAHGDRGAAEWLARQTRQRRPHARADLRLGQSLDDRYLQTKLAMRDGRVNLDQARVIAHALDQLPQRGDDAVTVDELARAETFLVDHAAHHDARDLAVLGKRLFEVIAPDEADAREGRALEAEEREAARRVSFSMREDDQGVVHGRFRVSRLHGAMLEKALQSLTSPEPDRPLSVRRGEAFGELVERLCARDLPDLGGGDATVVVTTTLDDLLGRLDDAGVATLDTGARISATEARRLACRHRVLPAVLGGQGETLDLGRSRRLHSKAQRVAMAVTQGGCTAEHCRVPAALCHAHHDVPWSLGGSTDVRTGRLLCPHHHRRVHDPAYDHRLLSDGRLAFHRRE